MTAVLDHTTAPGVSGFKLLRMMPEFKRNTLQTFVNLVRVHGDIVCLRGRWTSFVLSDPLHIEQVLQTNSRNYRKGVHFKEFKASTGNGLLVSEGEVWRRQRRLSQPAFHQQRIASFGKIITDATGEMLDRWQHVADSGSPIDVDAEMLRLTLGIVGKALFSRDLSNEADTMSRSFEVIRKHTTHRIMSVFKFPAGFPTIKNRRFRQAIGNADKIIYGLIAERRRHGGDENDLLSLLMAAKDEETGEHLSDKELRDQAITIIGAGYETTKQALTWTWYLLAKNPAAETRLRSEVANTLRGQRPTVNDLHDLKYSLMVFREAMRLYPAIWMISRAAINDDVIGGYRIPANSQILMLPYITHRSPNYWSNPEIFDPEHFLSETETVRPRYAYFPFGGGPRQCIGNNFALMEAQLIISMVVQKYSLRLINDQILEPETSITLRPRGGLKMTLHSV